MPAAQVVALDQPAELRQAEYYKAMLDEQRGRLEDEIADHSTALQTSQNNGEVHKLRRIIAEKRREQFERTAFARRCRPDSSPAKQHAMGPRDASTSKSPTTVPGGALRSPRSTLALQAPVAGDLRAIIGSIQIAANIDRMGALALHVAKIARRRHPQHAIPEQVNGYFAEMGRVAVELGNSAQEVLLTRDPDKAARIDEEDDAMDDLHRRLFSVLMDHEWKHGVAAAVDITLLGRFYERFADHTVEVARRVIFQATGKFPVGD